MNYPFVPIMVLFMRLVCVDCQGIRRWSLSRTTDGVVGPEPLIAAARRSSAVALSSRLSSAFGAFGLN
jgi:hypothetical protein